MPDLTANTMVDHYRVQSSIGAGSMGDVVRALDIDLGRSVAIKILSERHRENSELRARFVREARAAAAISHANVVQVFGTGTFDGRPYIAMELLNGVDLGTVIAEYGTMTSLQAARAALDAARGLQAAAQAGLIHRDVKPSNLVLVESGLVKVTDFGLAKPLDPGNEPALTALGVVVGTPDYIAPEQARGDAIDERVDIYALGGTLYFLVVGTPPYRKGNPIDDKYLKVVARHLKDPPPDALSRDATLFPPLCHLGTRMMSKRPADRPHYAELIGALSGIVDRLQRNTSDLSQPVVAIERGSSAPSAPTPFTGGKHRRITEVSGENEFLSDDSGETWSEASESPGRSRWTDDSEDGSEDRSGDSWGSETALPGRRLPRWLFAATAVAVAVFVAGAFLFFGEADEPQVPSAGEHQERAAGPEAAPQPPEGSVLVAPAGASSRVFLGKKPVTEAEYSALFPRRASEARPAAEAERPATGVSQALADAYARARGGRLPTAAELEAAAALEGFVAEKSRWEWLEPKTTENVYRAGETAARDSEGHADVVFRVARDL